MSDSELEANITNNKVCVFQWQMIIDNYNKDHNYNSKDNNNDNLRYCNGYDNSNSSNSGIIISSNSTDNDEKTTTIIIMTVLITIMTIVNIQLST